ncbi:putative acylamino-acid-releasing enzyme [Thozetella sp. PMI_491]|nr:putative acylamino-acid-releasing enzyme [Thozetella sp. PMI_491]
MDLIEPLLDLEVPIGLQLSPDGRSVAYSTRLKWWHRKGDFASSSIWIAQVGEEKSARAVTSGHYDRLPVWAPDSKSIAFLSDRGKRGKAHGIYLLRLDGNGEPKPLTPSESEGRISKLRFSPDGKYVTFVSTPEKSPERKAKEEAKDDAHGSRIAVATHRTPHIESRDTDGVDVHLVSVSAGHADKICNVPQMLASLVWARSSLFFLSYSISGDDASGFAVYAIDLEKDNPGSVRVAHGEEDCPMKLGNVGQDVVVLVQRGEENEIRFLNGKVLVVQNKSILEFHGVPSQGGDTNHPTEVFSTSTAGMASVQLTDHGKTFEGQNFGVVSFVECRSFDDQETLDGLFITPARLAGPDRKPSIPLPTYVSVHGGPYDCFDSGDVSHLIRSSLLTNGHAILMPNYRGSCGRGSRFASYAKGGMGLYDEPDVVAITQHAIEQGLADKNRLVIGGWSQGGFLSYLSAVRNGKHGLGWRFRGAIPGAGVTDWDTMVLTSDKGFMEAGLAGGEMWDLEKNDLRTRTGSALWEFKDAVRDGRIPALLMLHGEVDQRVPVSQAWGFRRALIRAGLPFELVTYPREGHMLVERKHIEDLIQRILRFAQTHLS